MIIRNQILTGDVRDRLTEIPDASVHCIITSPPYWALRDYGHSDQLGTEHDVEAWVRDIVAVCQQLKRVLVPDGALWLNLGDSYSRHPREGAAKKSLLLGPQRVALWLTQAGWLLRNQVIWAKRNPMPSSVSDRLTTTHEMLYFFTKQPDYYFNLNAIRENTSGGHHPRAARAPQPNYPPRAAVPALGHGASPRVDLNQGLAGMKATGRDSHPLGKNPGDVWTLATASYRGAHFATFPLELVQRPLLSTCPERVCDACGTPWRPAMQRINGRALATGPLHPDCACGAGWKPGLVLDPFLGSGTVAVAAEQHHRDWLGVELNPVYVALANQRLATWRTQNGPRPANRRASG